MRKEYNLATGEITEHEDAPVTPHVDPIPTVVDMRQARLALLGAGLLSNIDAAIAALPSPDKEYAQIEWEFSPIVKRDSPLVQMLSGSLGLDEPALDALFIAAGNL